MKQLMKRMAKWWTRSKTTSNLTKRNSVQPTFDQLEDRWAPAVLSPVPPNVQLVNDATSLGGNSVASRLTTVQLRDAYGINNISFNGAVGDGSGQTIAIVGDFNDPNLLSDLDTFDQAMKLTVNSAQTLYQQYGAASSFVTVYNEQGAVINPASTNVPVDPTGIGEMEEALDIEIAHGMAPGARIVLVEASAMYSNDLDAAVRTAAGLPGVSVVSMSFGGGEYASETQHDSVYTTPAGHQGVTFVAASGDTGAPGEYSAFSPNVVAVGGSVLTLGANNSYGSEIGSTGSGGGISLYESEPSYQLAFQTSGMRGNPDVAFDAGASVSVYNSYHSNGWSGELGTSIGAPAWASLFAIVNQGRALNGLSTLNSNGNNTEALQALYSLSQNDFHSVSSPAGINGTTTQGLIAGSGYDYVTGRGTPVADVLVQDLANYGKTVSIPAAGNGSIFATGSGPGSAPVVNVYNAATGAKITSFYAFPAGFTGGVRVAVGDVNGDGTPDIVAGAGPGGGPEVAVFDGKSLQMIKTFNALSPTFTGGIFVAVGDVNGDGYADIITSADKGGGPQVAIWSGRDNSLIASFYATTPTFTGGIRVASGDLTGDGYDDVIAVAGPGGGPQVTIFDARTLTIRACYYAMDPHFMGGLYVAVGDVEGNGRAQIITGADQGGGPQVTVFDGSTMQMLSSFYALAPSFDGGVRVGVADPGTGMDKVLTAAGPGGGPQVASFDPTSWQVTDSFYAYDKSFTGGIYLGGQ